MPIQENVCKECLIPLQLFYTLNVKSMWFEEFKSLLRLTSKKINKFFHIFLRSSTKTVDIAHLF